MPHSRFISGTPRLAVRVWDSDGANSVPFLLVHGLASNGRTWDRVADVLAEAGHTVAAIDLRGHGQSEKTDEGYDFATMTADLAMVIDELEFRRPVVVGQSWGGNVALAMGAAYQDIASGFVFVDGGTIDLQAFSDGSWEATADALRPPALIGMGRDMLAGFIRAAHPTWEKWGIEATLANFEIRPDGTVRPWLTLERHMRILRSLWEQRPPELYPLLKQPVLLCMADTGDLSWTDRKRRQVSAARQGVRDLQVHWFPDTAHDIHIHRPRELSALVLAWWADVAKRPGGVLGP